MTDEPPGRTSTVRPPSSPIPTRRTWESSGIEYSPSISSSMFTPAGTISKVITRPTLTPSI